MVIAVTCYDEHGNLVAAAVLVIFTTVVAVMMAGGFRMNCLTGDACHKQPDIDASAVRTHVDVETGRCQHINAQAYQGYCAEQLAYYIHRHKYSNYQVKSYICMI